MVKNITSLGKSGTQDFLLLRISAVLIATYTIFILGFIIINHPISYLTWHQLFQSIFIKIFTILTLVALLIHAWIGSWQVLTDYVKNAFVRATLQVSFILLAISYLIAGTIILWGV